MGNVPQDIKFTNAKIIWIGNSSIYYCFKINALDHILMDIISKYFNLFVTNLMASDVGYTYMIYGDKININKFIDVASSYHMHSEGYAGMTLKEFIMTVNNDI